MTCCRKCVHSCAPHRLLPNQRVDLAVVEATGQWKGQSGQVERERAEVVTVLHAGDAPARRAVEEIAAEYKRRFQQEAVLRERTTACTHS